MLAKKEIALTFAPALKECRLLLVLELKIACVFTTYYCGNGGIGRRIRFRGVRLYGCAGSTPASRTVFFESAPILGRFFSTKMRPRWGRFDLFFRFVTPVGL